MSANSALSAHKNYRTMLALEAKKYPTCAGEMHGSIAYEMKLSDLETEGIYD